MTKVFATVAAGLTVMVIAALIASTPPVGADPIFNDIDTTWAKEHIANLTNAGIIQPESDGAFRPNDPLTRAELADMITKAFTLIPKGNVDFSDIDDHPSRRAILNMARGGVDLGSIGGKFLPDESVSRDEFLSVMVPLLRLDPSLNVGTSPSFSDVPDTHRHFNEIEIAYHLDIIPPYIHGVFQPTLATTRAEAAAMIDEAMHLRIEEGIIDNVDTTRRLVTVERGGEKTDVRRDEQSWIFRNGRREALGALLPGDRVKVIFDRPGKAKFFIATGTEPIVDTSATVEQPTHRGGIFTPTDVTSILSGDWTRLQNSFKEKISDEMVAVGIEPEEARAIVERDWENIVVHGEHRVAALIAHRLGVEEELVTSVLQGDLDRLRDYAETQVLQGLSDVLFGREGQDT